MFTAMPVLELYLLFQVGGEIGGFNTVLIVLITGVVGASLARSQGRAILSSVQTNLQQGNMPADSLIHGFLVLAGGLLLLTPGFITDIMGFCMVAPGTRHTIVAFLKRYIAAGIRRGNIRFGSFHVYSGANKQDFGDGFSTSYTNQSFEKNNIKEAKVIDVDHEKLD